MEYNFFATISRMKYIDRWALMRNSRNENLSEHSLEVAMIAHALCVIGNARYERNLNADRAALIGLYHDSSEIITGDMPTPVKYYNPEIKDAYKQVEKIAEYIGYGCVTLINAYDPEIIVIGDSISKGNELLLPTIKRVVKERTLPEIGERVRIEISNLSIDPTLYGAAAIATDRVLRKPSEYLVTN